LFRIKLRIIVIIVTILAIIPTIVVIVILIVTILAIIPTIVIIVILIVTILAIIATIVIIVIIIYEISTYSTLPHLLATLQSPNPLVPPHLLSGSVPLPYLSSPLIRTLLPLPPPQVF